KESLPGGNTRTGVYYPPFPIYAERGEGVHLIDLDGHRLLDFVNNNTALILGHAHPAVVEALQNQIAGGTGFSRPLPLEVELAELLRARMPSLERLRFASSGTEAVLNALRVARAFTGRNKVAKFEGAYHGVDEYAMVSFVPPVGPELGPPDRPRPYPSSAGITPAAVDQVIILPFNDPDACEAIISEHADDLAAVIVDPLSTGAGMTLPADGFLAKLREIADRAGVLLIFDEIISFRVARGGAQERFGVRPDLACMGKVVAGGTPGSVFGGRADVMAQYDPATGDPGIQQSGTYNANPIAMVAGLTTLRLLTPEAYEKLDAITQRLGSELESVFAEADLVAQVTTVGSLFRVHFLPGRPRNYREAAREDASIHRWLFFALLARGVYWKQGGNVSLPMEDAHIDQLISAIRSALGEL
ncbi:MAG: aspartate aminotransferase family protein, partial [Candidatus Latescibacteria bacterium]|nr:aspartate aminotransferase family protein [Candidatus Latescibacterota bacterium]